MNVSTRNFANGFLALLVMLFASVSLAHNKVVVIPMAGDTLKPFAPIPADRPSSSDYASANGVSLDKVTDLQWQKTDMTTLFTFADANAHCLGLTLDGKTDWRLPTMQELLSIVDFGAFNPATNSSAFTPTGAVRHWSSTYDQTGFRRVLNSSDGSLLRALETNTERVRCVRSNGQNALISVFKDNGDGSVTDLATSLIWQQTNNILSLSQAGATTYCLNLVMAGSRNWRLPEIKELGSLIDFRLVSPVIDTQVFPTPRFQLYWTSSSTASNPSRAWFVDFESGFLFSALKSQLNNVRCVR